MKREKLSNFLIESNFIINNYKIKIPTLNNLNTKINIKLYYLMRFLISAIKTCYFKNEYQNLISQKLVNI